MVTTPFVSCNSYSVTLYVDKLQPNASKQLQLSDNEQVQGEDSGKARAFLMVLMLKVEKEHKST